VEKAPLSSTPFLALKSNKVGQEKENNSSFRPLIRVPLLGDEGKSGDFGLMTASGQAMKNLLVQDGAIDQNAKESFRWRAEVLRPL
jgi:hypothetical protein